MRITTVDFYSSKGQRSTNQDFVFPVKTMHQNNLFMVCDGVGGKNAGEIASKLAGLSIYQYLTECASDQTLEIKEALEYAHKTVLRFGNQFPENQGMSTTVALVHQFKNAFYAAWVGDSRIYHIRNGQILFQSKDHSYWHWLNDRGYLENEACKVDVKDVKNIIVQAIGGEKQINPSIVELRNVEPGDQFLLVTDGVLEAHTEDTLKTAFSSQNNITEILQEIISLCHQKSNDNFSAYILEVAE